MKRHIMNEIRKYWWPSWKQNIYAIKSMWATHLGHHWHRLSNKFYTGKA